MGAACFPAEADLKNLQPRFQTSQSSVLHFKNIRQVYYAAIEQPRATVMRYEPAEPTVAPNTPGWKWFMGHHWQKDRAYLFSEPSEALSADPCRRTLWSPSAGKRGATFSLPCPGIYPQDNFNFAVGAYRYLLQKRIGTIEHQSGKISPLFPLEENQRRFERLVRDYLELVDLL